MPDLPGLLPDAAADSHHLARSVALHTHACIRARTYTYAHTGERGRKDASVYVIRHPKLSQSIAEVDSDYFLPQSHLEIKPRC